MIHLRTDLLRVVYFSRNRIDWSPNEIKPEIDKILKVSQKNNSCAGVTGALIYNKGVFGQVLEGPRLAVEETFERIQMDDRHIDVTILEVGPISAQSFPQWTMGFVGVNEFRHSSDLQTSLPDFDISLLSGENIFEVLHSLILRNELSMTA